MNRKKLSLDYERMSIDFINMIIDVANKSADDFWKDTKSGLKFSSDSEMESAKLESKGHITARVIFNALAILESYGTGSKMDKSNPALNEYFQSKFINPLRQGYEIVGRPYGQYTDIFGREQISSGSMAGTSVENIFPAKEPSYSIQNAEKWLKQGGRINRLLNDKIKLFFSKSGKYFTYR